MKKEIEATADAIREAKKEGYKYAVQFGDSERIYVCHEASDEEMNDMYLDEGYEGGYNPNQEPEKNKHMGCPIGEAIEWFELD